jgi:hypothetical protein
MLGSSNELSIIYLLSNVRSNLKIENAVLQHQRNSSPDAGEERVACVLIDQSMLLLQLII